MDSSNNTLNQSITINKRVKIVFIFMAILVLFFILKMFYLSIDNKSIKPKIAEIKDRALRGSIISADGYTISRSIKHYSASIYTSSLDPKKKNFFLKLFSIYTRVSIEVLESKFYTKSGKPIKGWITLADNIDSKTAIYLKDLKYKLNRFKVFRARGINKNFFYGLTIAQKGEKREFPLKEALSPILGYTRGVTKSGYTKIVGYNGIEKFYEKYLNTKRDGIVKGRRDAIGYVIQRRDTKYKTREDGFPLVLNISLALQKNLDLILDNMKQKIGAQEIIAAVMKSKDSKIIAITSSNRYNPLHITTNEIVNLQPKATTYAYEAGSVLKPISYAIALSHNVITPDTIIDTKNGQMYIGRYKITDDEPFETLSAKQIIVKSSNIGISQITWRLKAKEFRDGLLKFGLGRQKSGIDIGKESLGSIYSLKKLESRINRTTTSYGYGIKVTFAQLLKAYNTFNNNGVSYSPRVVHYLIDREDKKVMLKKEYTLIRPVLAKVANIVKDALIAVVKEGTGKKAITKGLEVGGKTGTAMISRGGRYLKEYHSSFFGFANDTNGNRYTIGVLVIQPDYRHHFASSSAVPVFKKIVDAMVDQDLLKPNLTKEQELERKRVAKAKDSIIKQKQKQRTMDFKERLRKQREQLIKEQKRVIKEHKRDKKFKKIEPKKIEQKPMLPAPDLF